jgi:hypothetical protein
MNVLITNLTDAPGSLTPPTQVDIYNKTIGPGDILKLPANLIDKKIRTLEVQGIISIGQVPSWYANAKAKKGKVLSPEEKAKRISRSSQDIPKKVELSLVEELLVEDNVAIERKRKR